MYDPEPVADHRDVDGDVDTDVVDEEVDDEQHQCDRLLHAGSARTRTRKLTGGLTGKATGGKVRPCVQSLTTAFFERAGSEQDSEL